MKGIEAMTTRTMAVMANTMMMNMMNNIMMMIVMMAVVMMMTMIVTTTVMILARIVMLVAKMSVLMTKTTTTIMIMIVVVLLLMIALIRITMDIKNYQHHNVAAKNKRSVMRFCCHPCLTRNRAKCSTTARAVEFLGWCIMASSFCH